MDAQLTNIAHCILELIGLLLIGLISLGLILKRFVYFGQSTLPKVVY